MAGAWLGRKSPMSCFWALADGDGYFFGGLLSRPPPDFWLSCLLGQPAPDWLADLAIKLQLSEDGKWNVPYARIKKWSSGQDLMPVTVGVALSKMTMEDFRSRTTFILARALAFVVDFLVAAAPGEKPKRVVLQEIVHDRYIGLVQNLRTAIYHSSLRPTQGR